MKVKEIKFEGGYISIGDEGSAVFMDINTDADSNISNWIRLRLTKEIFKELTSLMVNIADEKDS